MSKAKALVVPGAVFVLAVAGGGRLLQSDVGLDANLYVKTRVLDEVLTRIERHFVEEVDVERLADMAPGEVVGRLGDPNSGLLRARDWEDMRIRTRGEYGGVGLEVADRDSLVTIVAPIPGTPGSRAGLRPGDRIVEVEGRSVEGWRTEDVARILRGEPGTDVRMGVRRHGAERIIPFEITREVIRLKAVPFAVLLEGGVGYVPVEMFNGTTTEEVRTKLDSLGAEGMTSLILDLRRNRGGLLLEGVGLSDLFLDAGSEIVEVRGRGSPPDTYRAASPQLRPELPVAVLVDHGSASAAEIVAGALQDHDRALLIGAPTFGKGSVQSLFPVSDGRVLKLTTARWYTSSGRSIQKDPHQQLIDVENGAVSLGGEVVQYPDSADRPRYTSSGGRIVLGGGGIVPDLWILPDTLTSAEGEAVRRLFGLGADYVRGLRDWAVRYLQEHPVLRPGFTMTDADLADFHASLAGRGVEVTLAGLRQARRTVQYHMGSEVALQAWDDRGRFLRNARHDAQLRSAAELLRAAGSRRDLFELAGRPLGESRPGGDAPEVGGSGTSR